MAFWLFEAIPGNAHNIAHKLYVVNYKYHQEGRLQIIRGDTQAGEMAQRANHLLRKHEDLKLDPCGQCKDGHSTLHLQSQDPMVRKEEETRESLEAHGPASLAYAVVNSKKLSLTR